MDGRLFLDQKPAAVSVSNIWIVSQDRYVSGRADKLNQRHKPQSWLSSLL